MFTLRVTGRKKQDVIPDGFTGGFVFNSGGEGGVSLILKQEGQRWLHSFYKKKERKKEI